MVVVRFELNQIDFEFGIFFWNFFVFSRFFFLFFFLFSFFYFFFWFNKLKKRC